MELTDCVAEVDKFSACSDAGKERFEILKIKFHRPSQNSMQAQNMAGCRRRWKRALCREKGNGDTQTGEDSTVFHSFATGSRRTTSSATSRLLRPSVGLSRAKRTILWPRYEHKDGCGSRWISSKQYKVCYPHSSSSTWIFAPLEMKHFLCFRTILSK